MQSIQPAFRARLTGWGGYLPEPCLSNGDLAVRHHIDTDDDWIVQRTGIHQRHIAPPEQVTSDLAVMAAQQALAVAGLQPNDVQMIIVATTTPDQTFPASAVHVQRKLGNQLAIAFDVQAVCSGFVYALSVADQFIRSGQVSNALVIGAETLTRLLDWNNRTTAVLFGDGAGAVVLQAEPLTAPSKVGASNLTQPGIISTHLYASGHYANLLYTDGGVSSTQTVGKLQMNGREVFRLAVEKLQEMLQSVLTTHQLQGSDIDWLVPHQANIRIIQAMQQKLALPDSRIIVTIDQHANTSAASIPLALNVGLRDGRIKAGDLVLLEAMGGGFTWGAALIRI
ncbi:MAG: ketoacyl-ACP synthase III [Alphaproteobacteria bacterium]|nr:ketoacyl-ACP synthase III [Alphaproteobacteria bacterium]